MAFSTIRRSRYFESCQESLGGDRVKKRYRLRNRRDFDKTYKRGKSLVNSCLVLVYSKNRLPVTRVGFSASKKFGNAVHRNKVKRRLKEIYRQKINEIKPGYDLIFVVRKGARDADFKKLEGQMYGLLNKARLLEAP